MYISDSTSARHLNPIELQAPKGWPTLKLRRAKRRARFQLWEALKLWIVELAISGGADATAVAKPKHLGRQCRGREKWKWFHDGPSAPKPVIANFRLYYISPRHNHIQRESYNKYKNSLVSWFVYERLRHNRLTHDIPSSLMTLRQIIEIVGVVCVSR